MIKSFFSLAVFHLLVAANIPSFAMEQFEAMEEEESREQAPYASGLLEQIKDFEIIMYPQLFIRSIANQTDQTVELEAGYRHIVMPPNKTKMVNESVRLIQDTNNPRAFNSIPIQVHIITALSKKQAALQSLKFTVSYNANADQYIARAYLQGSLQTPDNIVANIPADPLMSAIFYTDLVFAGDDVDSPTVVIEGAN